MTSKEDKICSCGNTMTKIYKDGELYWQCYFCGKKDDEKRSDIQQV
jgi:hypothetical protein